MNSNYRNFGASDILTITRDAWNDLQAYIERLEVENEQLKEELYGSDDSE